MVRLIAMAKEHSTTAENSTTQRLFEETNWSESPLGDIRQWDPYLRSAADICLNSTFPMTLALGPDPDNLINIYNDGYIPIVSQKHPSAFGQSVQDAYGEIWLTFLRERAIKVFAGECVTGKAFLIPLQRDGVLKEGYFDFSYSPVHDSHGEIRGALSTATEVTDAVLERRRNQIINRLSQRLLQANRIDLARDVIAEVLMANSQEFEALSLIQKTADMDEPVILVSSSPDFAEEAQTLGINWDRGVEKIGESSVVMTVIDEPENSAIGFALIVRFGPLVSVDDGCVAFVRQLRRTLLIHLERIRENERKLASQERQYRALFERSFDGILLTSPDGQVYAANPSACQLLGYSETEICERGRQGLLVSPDSKVEQALEERHATGRFVGELEYQRKDGSTFVGDTTSVTYQTSEGMRSIVVFRDATERRQNKKRSETSARLEAIGQLTGGIAHDFNNLLQIIINASEELLDSVQQEKDKESVNLIFSTSLRAADLIRQLLAFSRQQSLDSSPINVSKIIEELNQIIHRGTAGNIKTRFDLKSDEHVTLDAAQLESAIINLVINAKDALSPEGGTIEIATRVVDVEAEEAEAIDCEPGRFVKVSVKDNGTGIAPGDLPRVIEPFFTTKETGKGTGLGLSMVFGFVRQSEGAFRIDSTPGQGTQVELFFPVVDSAPQASPDSEKEDAPPAHGNGERILLVDDNQMLADVLARILEKNGYNCVVSLRAEEALQMIDSAAEVPDLLITDVDLGQRIDGWTLISKARERLPGLPAIVMSGFDPNEQQNRQDSSIPFIRKPFQSRAVNTLVANLLEKSARSDS